MTLKTCSQIIFHEMQAADKAEDEQEICSLCGEDLYGEPFVTPEGFKTHHPCYAIEINKHSLT